ncbi:fungal-specific transcription factor domain-containing protein [Podospora australis]|uniref:Fungal-specific transcription factor domain-containing protein n=1 Tax=Podospora australis TaxID=1536484 RepID=A0AAN7AFC9_9PEZI|nr:fungal-specific transcription factor domain-containing protein [Podospora australis]
MLFQCNGEKPCQTCVRRKLMCTYTPNSATSDYGPGDPAGSPTKRRHIDMSPPSIQATLETAGNEQSPRTRESIQAWAETQVTQALPARSSISSPTAPLPPPLSGQGHVRKVSINSVKKLPSRNNSHNTTQSNNTNGLAEETNIYTETRMLQDQTRRLLYIGDASTLSILQLIRIIVESTAGSEMGSPFIDDPKRHRIMENIIDFPDNTRVPTFLPDQETAMVLIDSYFTNTCGIVEVFDRRVFMQSVEACYRDPPAASNYFLCHLFLVLALGLLLAAPAPGSLQDDVIQKQLSARPDRAELFFRSARTMCDPGAGFEDADFWSVQALCLMTLYMLIISKRNTAYAYLGMAVRSAYALGLHREETMRDVIFTEGEMKVRRNIWKTLFILDRFLAATLGRPTAISGHDCSMKIFHDDGVDSMIPGGPCFDPVHAKSLDKCVETCRIIGDTLRVFSSRKISTTKVQEIIDDMPLQWEEDLQSALHRRLSNGGFPSAAHGIANLHVNLLSLHSLILLTRQLFVMHNWMLVEQRSGKEKVSPIHESPMARFSEACVLASYQTIQLVQKAREEQYLPRRNPFVIYFVFAASLVICMNQFSSLYATKEYAKTISAAVDFMEYCTEIDPQAERVLDIIKRFVLVVDKWTKDHTYDAPPLSSNLGFLYSTASTPQPPTEPILAGPVVASPQEHIPARSAVSDPGLLTPPNIPKMALSDILAPVPPSVSQQQDVRMNGTTPPLNSGSIPSLALAATTTDGQATTMTIHPSIESPGYRGEIEFEFDNLWNNWINLPAQTASAVTAAAGIPTISSQFSPTNVAGTEPFGAYANTPSESRMPPPHSGIHGSIPLYRFSSSFG